jgi:hypothetical protein
MRCCISTCNDDPVLTVLFQYSQSPYHYCERHASRWQKGEGGWRKVLAWKQGVRSVTPINQGEANDSQDE